MKQRVDEALNLVADAKADLETSIELAAAAVDLARLRLATKELHELDLLDAQQYEASAAFRFVFATSELKLSSVWRADKPAAQVDDAVAAAKEEFETSIRMAAADVSFARLRLACANAATSVEARGPGPAREKVVAAVEDARLEMELAESAVAGVFSAEGRMATEAIHVLIFPCERALTFARRALDAIRAEAEADAAAAASA